MKAKIEEFSTTQSGAKPAKDTRPLSSLHTEKLVAIAAMSATARRITEGRPQTGPANASSSNQAAASPSSTQQTAAKDEKTEMDVQAKSTSELAMVPFEGTSGAKPAEEEEDNPMGVDYSADNEEDVGSDAEDEREQCQRAIDAVDKLVETLKRKPGDSVAPEGGKFQKKEDRLLVLLRAKRLLQEPPDLEDLEEGNRGVWAEPAEGREESDQNTSAPSQRVPAPPAPVYRHALRFMEECGFTSYDEGQDGATLVHICCEQSRTRSGCI